MLLKPILKATTATATKISFQAAWVMEQVSIPSPLAPHFHPQTTPADLPSQPVGMECNETVKYLITPKYRHGSVTNSN